MKEEYSKWITDNYPSTAEAYGQCYNATEEMKKVFPELIQVKGYYHSPLWGVRQHWWLQTTDGEIIDPTQHQFPGINLLDIPDKENYQELTEEPIGKCINCGKLIFENEYSSNICSRYCADQFHRSLAG